MKGIGQCYSEGFFFMVCFWVVCICSTKPIHVLYLLKNAEMQHQVVNAADHGFPGWDTNSAVIFFRLLLGK